MGENLNTKDHAVTINISYTDDKMQTSRIRTIEVAQYGPLPVTVPGDDDNPTQQTYVEAHEEYISYYDPLNESEGDYTYDGLEQGLNGGYLGWNLVIQGGDEIWCNIYYDGAEATWHIISKAEQSIMNLDEESRSAVEYCYNKNKCNDNGVTQGMTNSSGWLLPDIHQLEAMLASYYSTYPEFQNSFYWSLAAGKRRVGIWPYDCYGGNGHARTTKALSGDGCVRSDWDDAYVSESGTTGKVPHTGTCLHICVAYVSPSGVTIE